MHTYRQLIRYLLHLYPIPFFIMTATLSWRYTVHRRILISAAVIRRDTTFRPLRPHLGDVTTLLVRPAERRRRWVGLCVTVQSVTSSSAGRERAAYRLSRISRTADAAQSLTHNINYIFCSSWKSGPLHSGRSATDGRPS